jgi:hypothetical protein
MGVVIASVALITSSTGCSVLFAVHASNMNDRMPIGHRVPPEQASTIPSYAQVFVVLANGDSGRGPLRGRRLEEGPRPRRRSDSHPMTSTRRAGVDLGRGHRQISTPELDSIVIRHAVASPAAGFFGGLLLDTVVVCIGYLMALQAYMTD